MIQRRSRRVLLRIPVSLLVGQDPPVPGVTAIVNRHGALASSPIQLEEGTILWIRNELSLEAARCRVVYVGPTGPGDERRLGIDFVDGAPTFWGSAYDDALVTEIAQQGDLESDIVG